MCLVLSWWVTLKELFHLVTGERVETFLEILQTMGGNFPSSHGDSVDRPNRLPMTLIWLRNYPYFNFLSLLFNVHVSTVQKIIHCVFHALWHQYAHSITWPLQEMWLSLRGTWPDLPHAVGVIDGTSHKIWRPIADEDDTQCEYFSGHHHFHCFHTQVQ